MSYHCTHCAIWLEETDIKSRLLNPETRWQPAEYEWACPKCGLDEIEELSKCVECDAVATDDDWCAACLKAGIENGTIEVIA